MSTSRSEPHSRNTKRTDQQLGEASERLSY